MFSAKNSGTNGQSSLPRDQRPLAFEPLALPQIPTPPDDENGKGTNGRQRQVDRLPAIDTSPDRNIGGLPVYTLQYDIFSLRNRGQQNTHSKSSSQPWVQEMGGEEKDDSSTFGNDGDDDVQFQNTVRYDPALPPSKRRKELRRKIKYAMDNFVPPNHGGGIGEGGGSFSCKLCKFLILAQGEYLDTIKKIYKDNVGFFEPSCIFDFISQYWNTVFAGIFIESVSGHTERKRRGPKRRRRRTTDSELPTSSRSQEESDDDFTPAISSSSTTRTSTELSSTESESRKRKRNLEANCTHPEFEKKKRVKVRVPNVTASEVEYHFSTCYKEDNPKQMLMDQVQMLSEMQSVIYDGGVYCKRVKVGALEVGQTPNTLAPTTTSASLEILSTHMQDTLTVLKDSIQESVVTCGKLKEEAEDLLSKATDSDKKKFDKLMEIVRVKESAVREMILKYKTLKTQTTNIKNLAQNEAEQAGEAPAAPGAGQNTGVQNVGSEAELCLKIKESCLVQSLSKTISQLLREIRAVSQQESGRPIGLASMDYYRNLQYNNMAITRNDYDVMKQRVGSFANMRECGNPSETMMALGHYYSKADEARRMGSSKSNNGFVVGGTSARAKDMMGKTRQPKYTMKP